MTPVNLVLVAFAVFFTLGAIISHYNLEQKVGLVILFLTTLFAAASLSTQKFDWQLLGWRHDEAAKLFFFVVCYLMVFGVGSAVGSIARSRAYKRDCALFGAERSDP